MLYLVLVYLISSNIAHALWNSPIPYFIDKTIDYPDRIMNAINYIEDHTNWDFIPWTNETEYIFFNGDTDDCNAELGKRSNIPTFSNIAKQCSMFTVVHEICHILGLPHQHQYSNRDDHVEINMNNIEEGKYTNNFQKYSSPFFIKYLYSYPYDYGSVCIMDYGLFLKMVKKQ